MNQIIRVLARFVRKSDGRAIGGPGFTARLFDKDLLVDDKMGQAVPNSEGRVEITCDLSRVAGFDTLAEQHPDLYFVLYEGDRELFRSPVLKDVDFLARDPVSGEQNRLTQDLGTFSV